LLKGGTLKLVSEPYEYNTSLTAIFLKTYSEDALRCPYKDYSSLNRWQAKGIYFLYLLSVTMHRRQCKKVSILPPGDVNPRPVPSRRGLLEDSPYRAVGAAVRCAMSHDRAPRVCRDLEMSCGDLHKA
jgi:hypothetical protein